MDDFSPLDKVLEPLNPPQRVAVQHGQGPLLIVAGAGTGKTATLVHRVAALIVGGVDPRRILLLTFTRRAAAEMLHRVDVILQNLAKQAAKTNSAGWSIQRTWGGTFHAVATRLLRRYSKAVGLPPGFTIHDRGDSEDLMAVLRTELGLGKSRSRFPQKGTCMAIYSRLVNSRQRLDAVLKETFPWCGEWAEDLGRLFTAYVDRKEATGTVDYDDLLLDWAALMEHPEAGPTVRRLFDCVLVDEYQDTNALQAEILRGLCPDGSGLTVVGDDAQSIYSFRASTVRNILDFPKVFPGTTVVTLEQNYRSVEPILAATNAVIGKARQRYPKNLWSSRKEGPRPVLVVCADEDDQTAYVVDRILEHREAGIPLHRQAVLFRASHHSITLEAELAQRNIPFYKYGGLKFVEAAHVKDLLAFLRLAENPHDLVAGLRVLTLLPGIGPAKARGLMDLLRAEPTVAFDAWTAWKAPAAVSGLWPDFVALVADLHAARKDLPGQVHRVRTFYTPLLEERYDHPQPRARDLEQLEALASRYRDRATLLAELALDPPSSTQDLAGDPLRDDDYLVLSTIHSAKGLEWDAVCVIHATDGNIPSDMATGDAGQIEEERRLFYVALTRAKTWLYVCQPLRYYFGRGTMDAHGYAQRTRFLPDDVLACFDLCTTDGGGEAEAAGEDPFERRESEIRRRTRDLWG